MRRCRVLSGLQPLPNVGRIGVYAASGNQCLMRRCRVYQATAVAECRPDKAFTPHPAINADATLSRLIRPTNRYRLASGIVGYDGIAIACFSSSSFSTTQDRQASRYRPGCWYRPPQFSQNTAHNFAGAGFRQGVGPVSTSGVASGPISLRTQLRTSATVLVTVPPHD